MPDSQNSNPYYINPSFENIILPATYASLTARAAEGWNPLLDERVRLDPYLCQLMKNAVDPNIDSEYLIIQQKQGGFDYENYLNNFYSSLSAMKGDGRVDFGQVWNAVKEDFVPRATTQIEIAQSGGCQVVDGYICDSDGNKIKEASLNCREGEEYLKTITVQEVTEYVTNFILTKRQESADSFINFLKLEYKANGWSLTSYFYTKTYFYYVEAFKDRVVFNTTTGLSSIVTDRNYFKYYQDQKEYVAQQLQIPLNVNDTWTLQINYSLPESVTAFSEAMLVNIPDYTLMGY